MSAGCVTPPALKAFGTAGSGPVRGVFYDPGVERLFCVSGGEFYELGEGGAATKIGDVATGILPVTWASNGVGGQQIMLTSGGRGYIFDLRDDTFTPITAEHFPQNVIACAYIQTYFLVLPANSRRLRRPARRRPVGPRPRCANLRRTLASGCAPARRQMGTVLGRPPDPAAAARLGRRRGMLRRGPGRDATARRCLGAPRGQPCVDRPSDSSRHREPEGGRDGLAGGVDVLRGKGHYGHRSRKTTGWYAVGGALPGSGGGRAQRPVRSRLETTPQPSGGARSRWRPASASLTVNATPHRSHSAIS